MGSFRLVAGNRHLHRYYNFAGLVAPVLALPVTLVCIIAALLVMKNISRKRAAVAA